MLVRIHGRGGSVCWTSGGHSFSCALKGLYYCCHSEGLLAPRSLGITFKIVILRKHEEASATERDEGSGFLSTPSLD